VRHDLRDRRLDLALECRCCTLAALEIPEESSAGFLFRTRIKLDRKSHGVSAREDAVARFGPRHGLHLTMVDLGEPPFRFVDPGQLDLVGRLADAVE
jgi:hypothetical protein